MIFPTWELATKEQYPIVAYLCYDSSLPLFTHRKNPVAVDNSSMFSDVEAAATEFDNVTTGKRQEYRMRLGYTLEALQRRAEYGRDVPIPIAR